MILTTNGKHRVIGWGTRLLVASVMFLSTTLPASSQDQPTNASEMKTPVAVLAQAVMCEDIEEFLPKNASVVFSISFGRVCCFTEFDPVMDTTVVYHNWFNRNNLISSKRLTLKPPKWASFSSVQLREADIGPWRVEITDAEGNILKTLRFSVTK